VGLLLGLWFRFRARFTPGDFLLLYLMLYGIARFLLEFLRIEVAEAGGINVSQVISLGAALAGLIILLYRPPVRRLPYAPSPAP
jgi:phosphatidylglycerol:prolipoprotein diacylglycerol transferase